jgi:hypothetical protein
MVPGVNSFFLSDGDTITAITNVEISAAGSWKPIQTYYSPRVVKTHLFRPGGRLPHISLPGEKYRFPYIKRRDGDLHSLELLEEEENNGSLGYQIHSSTLRK